MGIGELLMSLKSSKMKGDFMHRRSAKESDLPNRNIGFGNASNVSVEFEKFREVFL